MFPAQKKRSKSSLKIILIKEEYIAKNWIQYMNLFKNVAGNLVFPQLTFQNYVAAEGKR
jgi:hypothetical protein